MFQRKRSWKKHGHTFFKSLKVKCADIEGSNKTTGLVWILEDTVFKKNKKKKKQTPWLRHLGNNQVGFKKKQKTPKTAAVFEALSHRHLHVSCGCTGD